jgi:hypothetical protein
MSGYTSKNDGWLRGVNKAGWRVGVLMVLVVVGLMVPTHPSEVGLDDEHQVGRCELGDHQLCVLGGGGGRTAHRTHTHIHMRKVGA